MANKKFKVTCFLIHNKGKKKKLRGSEECGEHRQETIIETVLAGSKRIAKKNFIRELHNIYKVVKYRVKWVEEIK